jgi:hypothetical protein
MLGTNRFAQLWDALGNSRPTGDNRAEPSPEALKIANEAWVAWAKVYGEMSIAASDEVWRMTEPMFYEMRSAYFQRRLPSGASRPGTRRRAPGADAARAGTLTVAHSPPAQAHRAGRPVADSLLVAARCAPPSPTTRHGVLPARPKVAELKCIATFITQHLRRRLVRYGGARSGAGPVRRSPGVLAAKIIDHVPPSWSGGRGRSPSPARGRRSWPGSCCWPSRGTTPTETCCRR